MLLHRRRSSASVRYQFIIWCQPDQNQLGKNPHVQTGTIDPPPHPLKKKKKMRLFFLIRRHIFPRSRSREMKLFACVSNGSSTAATKLLSSVINTRVTSASHSIMSHRRRNALVAVFTPGLSPSPSLPRSSNPNSCGKGQNYSFLQAE